MQTIESLKRSIRTAEDLGSVVRTMKTLASVNIRHYEKAVESLSEYYLTVRRALQVVLRKGRTEILSPTVGVREGLCAVVFGTDQGLCGSFNEQMVSYALNEMSGVRPEEIVLICVGVRAGAILREKGPPVDRVFPCPASLEGVPLTVHKIVDIINELEGEGRVSRVVLYHNRLVSGRTYEPQTVHLLPLEQDWFLEITSEKWPCRTIPTFTMDRKRLFSILVHQFIFVSLYRAFGETMASENAARLASMQAAERNIEERLDDLNLLFRNERQGSITSELLDIISGFEALRSMK